MCASRGRCRDKFYGNQSDRKNPQKRKEFNVKVLAEVACRIPCLYDIGVLVMLDRFYEFDTKKALEC